MIGAMLSLQAAAMDRFEVDLRRLSLKQDAPQKHAASAEELAAPGRALQLRAGVPAARLAPELLRRLAPELLRRRADRPTPGGCPP